MSRGGGTIVATASMAGLGPVAGEPIYSANKHAVVGFVRSLAEALTGDAIAVHALCPSFADTALIAPLRWYIDSGGFPILDVDDVVNTFFQILDSEARRPAGLQSSSDEQNCSLLTRCVRSCTEG